MPIIPAGPTLDKSYIKNESIDGATPKDTKSANESNSFPSSLETFNHLAILPSYLSTSAAIIIKKHANK